MVMAYPEVPPVVDVVVVVEDTALGSTNIQVQRMTGTVYTGTGTCTLYTDGYSEIHVHMQ